MVKSPTKVYPLPLFATIYLGKIVLNFMKMVRHFKLVKLKWFLIQVRIYCPFHRYEDGKDSSQIHLERLANLEGLLIKVPFQQTLEIGIEHFLDKALTGKAVLVYTGWSEHWQTDQYFENHPYLTKEAAEYLQTKQVVLVGIDSYNIDNTKGKTRPVHSILLKHEILIVEHLTQLNLLEDKSFLFSAIPPKIEGFGTFPVRAFATIQ